jgi:hypothetical protein
MKFPRKQHYAFAHKALPQIFFDNPEGLITGLQNRPGEVLNFIWNRVGEHEIEYLSSEGLTAEVRQLPDQTHIALVTMPPPEGMTEAYFMALVYRPHPNKFILFKTQPIVRYLTLEYSLGEENLPTAVLCEWHMDRHLNYGAGPEVDLQAFFTTVCEMVNKPTFGGDYVA